MAETNYRGIDYGMGRTNIDANTSIRYGVIPQDYVLQAWADSSEPHYGDPHCDHCGSGVQPIADVHANCDYEEPEFYCENCKRVFGPESAYGDEPIGFTLDDGEYIAESGEVDIFITKSPYYTRAQFCSPCAPGACYLASPCDDGERAYCFGPDWFDADIEPCPYPVYRVDTDELVYSPPADTDTND